LFQFEDFGNANGRRLLNAYRGDACAFNDDIQGTAASMLAGILAALPLLKGGLGEQTYLFAGAGETGTGMADLLAAAISKATRAPLPEARKRIWLFDSKGLVTRDRAEELEVRCGGASDTPSEGLDGKMARFLTGRDAHRNYSCPQDHKLPWAHPGPTGCTDLLSAVNALKPTCLVRQKRAQG
jgi:hypothetical protein